MLENILACGEALFAVLVQNLWVPIPWLQILLTKNRNLYLQNLLPCNESWGHGLWNVGYVHDRGQCLRQTSEYEEIKALFF